MKDLEQTNETRSMMKSDYGEVKADKSKELNDTMTLNEASRDEYAKTIHNIGGANNG